MTTEFGIYDYESGDAHTLALTGELDLVSAQALIEVVLQLCSARASKLLLDISELQFVDSTGLRALLAARTLCEEHCCEFSMTRAPRQIERLFELTCLFGDLPSREAPVASEKEPVRLWPEPAGVESGDA